MTKNSSLIALIKRFFENDPIEAVHSLQSLSEEEAIQVLKAFPPSFSARIFPHLPSDQASSFLQEVSPEVFKEICENLDPQQGATLLLNLPPKKQKELIDNLPEKSRAQIQELLSFPEDSVGRIMKTHFTAFLPKLTVGEAIDKIRSMAKKRAPLTYAYVIDEENKLVGILNMRDLMLADRDSPLESIMREDVFKVDGFMDRSDLANQLAEKRYFAVPVVDAEDHLIGVVKSDQLLQEVQADATKDIQRMFGVGVGEKPFSSLGLKLKARLPWLNINLVTAFLAAFVVSLFEGIIAKITVLAVFLPVVAGQGGNAGAQSLAVVMRGLVMREIPKQRFKELILKESLLGTLNGIIVGIVTAVVAWLWVGNPFLGVVIALAMIVNLFAASLSGTLIPITMKSVGLDPAQSSNIILTTVTDVVGFFSYLGFAVLFQGLLL